MAAIRTDEEALPRWSRSRSNLNLAELSRCLAFECLCNRRDVLRRISAAAARNIDQAALCKVAQITGHIVWSQIKPGLRQGIRQTRVRIARDRRVRLVRELLEKWIH